MTGSRDRVGGARAGPAHHRHRQRVRPVVEGDADLTAGSVPAGIGERLLHHAVGGAFDHLGHDANLATRLKGDVHARPLRLLDQAGQVGECRLRRQRRFLDQLVGAQQADQLAQLLQGLTSGGLHLVGQLSHLGRVLGGQLGRAGLQHHQADPVAHHVVHLPGDPDSFREDGATGLQLLGALRALGPLRRRQDQLGARRDVGAERRRPQHETTGDDHRTVQGPVVADHGEDDTEATARAGIRTDQRGW